MCCSAIYLYGGNSIGQSTTFSVVNCSNISSTITVGYNETFIANCHKSATVISGSGNFEKNDICVCTTATPTPTVTATPTKTTTPTVTPTNTPSSSQSVSCDDCDMEGVSFADI